MITVLLTGSNGFIGRKIACNLMANPDVNLVCTSFSDNLLSLRDVHFIKADLTSQKTVSEILALCKPEIVIHTAAQSQPDFCEANKEQAYALNVSMTRYLANEAEKYKSHMVFFSTDFVFKGDKNNYAETDEPYPLSYYGKTKLEAEKIVQNILQSWCIIRTIQVYGYVPGVKKLNLVMRVIRSLKAGNPLQIVADQYRTPTLVDDVAKATVQLALGKYQGIFHISGNQEMSVYEMAVETARFFNLNQNLIFPVTTAMLSEAALRPPITGFNLEKITSAIGYCPHSFTQGLKLMSEIKGLIHTM